jgi:hypothetical protein
MYAAPTHSAMYGVPPQQAQQQQQLPPQQAQGMPQQGMPPGQRPMGGPRSQGNYTGGTLEDGFLRALVFDVLSVLSRTAMHRTTYLLLALVFRGQT